MNNARVLAVAVAAMLLAVTVPVLCSEDTDGSAVTFADGTEYDYTTHGVDYDDYKAEIISVTTEQEVLYVSTTLEGYNVKDIDAGAFSGVPSKAIVIPERVETIGAGAFDGCPNLERIYFLCDRPQMDDATIPEGVEVLVLPGTSGWDGMQEIQVVSESVDGSTVDYIIIDGEATAWDYVPSSAGIVVVSAEAGEFPVKSVGPYMFGAPNKADDSGPEPVTDVKSVIIEDGVQEIRERAFYYCTGIESISIPRSVTVIMDEAFRYCINASSIDIPSSVTYIGFEAFRNCSALKEIIVPDSVTFVGEGAFKISGAERMVVGSGITVIPDYCLSDMYSLKTLEFRGEVTEIGDWAFVRDTSLEWIELPDTVVSLGDNAFSQCSSLKGLDMGTSLEYLGASAFYKCESLISVYVPATVEKVGDRVFSFCKALEDVYFLGEKPAIGADIFYKCEPTVHCTEANAASWEGYPGIVVGDIPDGPFPPSDDPKPEDGGEPVSAVVYAAALIVLVLVVIGVAFYLKTRNGR